MSSGCPYLCIRMYAGGRKSWGVGEGGGGGGHGLSSCIVGIQALSPTSTEMFQGPTMNPSQMQNGLQYEYTAGKCKSQTLDWNMRLGTFYSTFSECQHCLFC